MNNQIGFVYKKGMRAATLSHQGGNVEFQYNDAYLASGGRPVATTLPLSSEPLILNGSTTPAYFAGLLPEGRRLHAISDRLKTSASDDLSLLLEIGADLIGDVQVLLPGADPTVERESLKLPSDLSEISFTEIRERFLGARSTGIPGVQDKVSSKMLNARARLANVDYMLKLNPADVPFAVQNEAFFLGLARKSGLKVANYKILTDGQGQQALLLERFDRISTKEGKQLLAAEDGCQTANLYPADKYNIDFLQMGKRLASLCPASVVAGYQLFQQLVFNWLIGNGDAHAKNFSILESAAGEWRISPAYDLLCTRFYDDRTMALSLDDKKTDWSRSLLIDLAAELKVSKKAAEAVITEQLTALADLPDQIISGALPFRRDQNYDVAAFLKQRAKALA